MTDKIKTKQKVFGLKGSEYEGVEYCDPEDLDNSDDPKEKDHDTPKERD